MKTPPSPTFTVLAAEPASRVSGESRERIVVEPDTPPSSQIRERLKARVWRDYPLGKALERFRQFGKERGLPPPVQPLPPAPEGKTAVSRRARKLAATLRTAHDPGFRTSLPLPAWRELGPRLIPHGQTYGRGTGARPPVSGRCNGLVVDRSDPRHLVLCSAGGGLWGSFDEGATWTPLTDGAPTLVMGAIAQSPAAPHVMYAGTGEGDSQIPFGVGLLRSSDGGRTWTHVPSPTLTGVAIYAIAVHPVDAMQVWVASTAGLHVSSDGGATWRRELAGPCWSVSLHPLNPDEIFAAVESGLRRSVNGGTSWHRVALARTTLQTRFTRLHVAHAPSQPDVVIAAGCAGKRARLWRRGSAGGPFAAESTPENMDLTQAWYDWCLGIAPDDPDTVLWGAIDLYRGHRRAGRYSWEKVSSRGGDHTSIHPDQHAVAFDPSRPGTVYACNDGGLFRSRDLGETWESLNPGLGITEFEYLAQLASDPAWLFGGTQDNGSLARGGLQHWDQVALGDGGDCAVVDRGDASICYHSFYDTPVERAPTHGDRAFHWTDVSPPVPKRYVALFYPPLEACGSVLARAGVTLWVSDDEGEQWEEVLLPTTADRASALAIADERTVFIGTESGRMYRIDRGADGWSGSVVTRMSPLAGAYISDIVVVGKGARTVWVSCSSAPRSGGRVFRSTDGGHTWVDRGAGLPELAVNALVVDPANSKVLYAATDRGVRRTRNAGVSWSDFSNGLPNVIVGDLLFLAGPRRLRAGTRSRGAWEVDV
jgi:photosystem II stability/assembly factor-like uncharacterized protein